MEQGLLKTIFEYQDFIKDLEKRANKVGAKQEAKYLKTFLNSRTIKVEQIIKIIERENGYEDTIIQGYTIIDTKKRNV